MRAICFLALSVAVLMFSPFTLLQKETGASGGARSDLNITFYSNLNDAWTELVNGQVDFLRWHLAKEQKTAAEANPDIQVAKFDQNNLFKFAINNNYAIGSYPGVRSATNHINVRKAIAHLIDKDYIITDILGGYGERIDVPFSTVQKSWWNTSLTGSNYPYPYSIDRAAQLLAEAGFNDTDSDGVLNFPATWDGAGGMETSAYPLKICVPAEDVYRVGVGRYLIAQLEGDPTMPADSPLAHANWPTGFRGGDFDTTDEEWVQPRSVLMTPVFFQRDYQIYVYGTNLFRFPTYLAGWYDSWYWINSFYISNIETGWDKGAIYPNYPDLDMALRYGNWKKAQSLIVEKYCISVFLWSSSEYYAYRKELVGVVNMDGYGIENPYTFLNAYRATGGPITIAVPSSPQQLNILYSLWDFEYTLLDRVYSAGTNMQPYDWSVDLPWVVQDWDVGTWNDGSTTKTMVTYYIRKNVGIVAPVSGAFVRNFDAEDFEFSVWYNYAFDDSWQWGNFMDVHHTKLVDVNGDGCEEIQVFFDYQNEWLNFVPTYPLLPKDELLDLLCAPYTESFSSTGMNERSLTRKVVGVANASLDGTPLLEGIDYVIKAGYDWLEHNLFVPLRDLTGTVTITYLYPDIPARGFYLGGLPWQQTMYSFGMYYPVSMTHDPPSAGDTIVLAKNPYFFMDAPLIGEVDWQWTWTGTAKPRGGYFKVDILDIVKVTSAYSSRGDGAYDPNYFVAADLDASDLCHIGILDLVTVIGKYGQTFGTPPS